MSTSPSPIDALIERIGVTHFRQRYNIQIGHASTIFGQGRTLFHIENVKWVMVLIYHVLRLAGLYKQGVRNVLDIRITENSVTLPNLPDAFNGYTILHLSDLHIDITRGLTEAIIARVQDLTYDLCIITGDFRASTHGYYDKAIAETIKLRKHLQSPIYAVLGNHDFIEFVPSLEAAGIRFLLNETVTLSRGEAVIYLSGVDDPHMYETDNLQKTGDEIPTGATALLLAHSPEIYRKAAASGYDLMFCGHTHAGQICLPGRIPVFNNADCPRSLVYGRWRFANLQGYTSAGAGCSGVPVRFFCPPEITLHRLQCGER